MAPLRSSEKYTQDLYSAMNIGKSCICLYLLGIREQCMPMYANVANVCQCMPMLPMYANVYKGKIEPPSSAK